MATKKAAGKAKGETFPTEVSERVPKPLLQAFQTKLPKYEGMFAYGTPYASNDDKLVVRFDPHAAWVVMSTYGDSLPETEKLVPLATAGREGDECFAVDPSSAALPVFFFEHEAGYHPFAESLDQFLSGLLKKGEKTPLEKLEKLVDKASSLDEKGKYKDVVALLEPAVKDIPRKPDDTLARALNLLGMAYRHTKKLDLAIATLEEAARLGEDYAILNLCELYEEETKDFARSVVLAEQLKARSWKIGEMYEWFWSRNYIGRGALRLGDAKKATRAYHEIKADFTVDNPEYVTKATEGLREIAKAGGAPAKLADAILTWFAAPPRALDDARRAELRAWWKGVPARVRQKLSEAGAIDEKPSDEALARLVRSQDVDIEGCGVKDLGFLAAFRQLTSLDADENGFTDLSTLPKLPSLKRLRASNGALASTKGIGNAPNLEALTARDAKLKSLDGVEKLPRLRELDVASNKIADLEPLGDLRELEELTIYENAVTDLTPLRGCRNLRKLSCFGNDKIKAGLLALKELPKLKEINAVVWKVPVAELEAFVTARPDVEIDIEAGIERPEVETTDADRAVWAALGKEPQLRDAIRADKLQDDRPLDEQLAKLVREDCLFLADKGITSLAPLSHFRNLDFLDIARNEVRDLGPLAGLTKLEKIRAQGTRVASLKPLAKLTALLEVDVSGSAIEALDGIENARELQDLSFEDTKVTRLEPLAKAHALQALSFAGAPVEDLTAIGKHDRLRTLDCSGSAVKDLSVLAGCKSLERIDCYGLPGLTGLAKLTKLEHLRAVYSHGSLDPKEIEAFRKARPEVEVD